MTSAAIRAAIRAAVAAGGSAADVQRAAHRAAARSAGAPDPAPAPAVTSYRAAEGDMLDDIAHRHYGPAVAPAAALAAIVAANPGLVTSRPRLSAGAIVELPPIEAAAETDETVQLWD